MAQVYPTANDNAQVSVYAKNGSMIERAFCFLNNLAETCEFAKKQFGSMPKDGYIKVVPLEGKTIPFM